MAQMLGTAQAGSDPASTTQPAVDGTTQRTGYRPALDGIRALAVTSVVAYHFGVGPARGGFLGVDVFFVLSGYLITSILLAEHATRGRISLRAFYIRRARRLFPALAMVIAATAVATALYASPLELGDRFRDMVAALFYYANWHFISSDQSYFAGLAGASPLRHTWSLAIEEQFYFVWPVLLLVLLRLGALRHRWVLLAGAAGLTALSAWAMAHTFDPEAPSRAYYGSDGRAQQLLIGVLLAVATFGLALGRRNARIWSGLGLLGLVAVLISVNRYSDQASFYYLGGALLLALFTAVLIAGVESNPSGGVAQLLSLRPVAWLGRISYGVYLWHWPVLVWVKADADSSGTEHRLVTLLRVALTLLLASASFTLVERPIRLGTFPWLARGTRRTPIAFVTSLALLSGAAYATTRPTVQQHLTRTSVPAVAIAQAADGSVTSCPRSPDPCRRVSGPKGALVVSTVGDSTMQAYDPALTLLAKQHRFEYVQGAVGGCPLGHRLLATGRGSQLHKTSNHVCFDETPAIYDALLGTWHTDVFIATSSNELSRSVSPDGQLLTPGSPEHLAATEAALTASVAKLSRDAYVVLLHLLPRGPGVRCLESGPATAPRCNVPVAKDTLTPVYNRIFDRVAARFPERVRVVDLSDVVCPGGTCPVMIDGIVMRYDGGHFTRRASEYVAPFLYDRIRRAGVPLP